MTDYRYYFLSLRDEQVLQEISLFGVYMRRMLGNPGQFNGSFTFDQTGKDNSDLVAATVPGKTWVVAERNGVPVWWGIVWSRVYQSQAKECQLFGWGFESYPQKQVIETDYIKVGGSAMPNTDMFGDLWQHMQARTGSNLNINVPSSLTDGPLKETTVLATDAHYYWDVMSQLAEAADGFDWTIDCTKNADGSYNKALRVGWPTLDNSPAQPDVTTFAYPGSILNYYATESIPDAGTDLFVYGAGEGSAMPFARTTQPAMLAQGWPRWDVNIAYKEVTSQTQIDQLALQQQITRKPPMPVYQVTVKGDQDPEVGSYNVGQTCILQITDPRHPSPGSGNPGLDITSRIIGFEIRPNDSSGTEEVNVMLPGDTVNG